VERIREKMSGHTTRCRFANLDTAARATNCAASYLIFSLLFNSKDGSYVQDFVLCLACWMPELGYYFHDINFSLNIFVTVGKLGTWSPVG
jgi:hypothetical protein